jgi:class 3 adenylate cyclase/ABC-type branched-subunit amino acid transport system substrate-binding protein/streptogramin lyase
MAELPSGTVTLLFTDVEGSTRLLKQLGERYSEVLEEQQRLLREAFAEYGGREIDTQGDSFFVAFRRAKDAVEAAIAVQRALAAHRWPDDLPVRVRIGIHTGEPTLGSERYVGFGVHRAARISSAGHGGQILISNATRELIEDELPEGVSLRDLGQHRLKDIDRPERLFQLVAEGLPAQFLPLKTIAIREHSLRRRNLLFGALAGVVAAAIAIPVFALSAGSSGSGNSKSSALAAGSIGAIDVKTNRIVAQIPLTGGPVRLAASAGRVWVGADDAGTISALDPRSRRVTKLVSAGAFPSDLAAGEGALWLFDGKSGMLVKVDPAYGVTSRVRVSASNPAYDSSREGFDPVSVAVGSGSVWLTNGSRRLVQVDPTTSRVIRRIDLGSPLDAVAIGAGAVWAISGVSATAIRLDPSGEVSVRIPIVSKPGFESPYPLAVAVGEGFVWVLNGNTATVTKIDPMQRTVAATISIGIDHGPLRLAVGGGAVWIANGDGTLARVDAGTNDVKIIPLSHRLNDVAVVGGAVWVTAGSGLSSSVNATTSTGGVRALPPSSCSPIYYGGGGQPQYLIASDLQLQGYGTSNLQLSQAIQYVLRSHRFRAGEYAVGYQSCDDSTAGAASFSEEKCAANARAYAQNTSVVGVIGSFISRCSEIQAPILNQAPGGPLALLSFSNTYPGLTRSGPGTAPGEPGLYHPTGVRNYARIIANDKVQAAADAILARQLGSRKIYVVYEDFGYGLGIATAFESTAVRLGLTIVGRTAVPALPRYKSLAKRVAKAHPDAVLIAGSFDPSRVALIKELRRRLGSRVRLMAPDGFSSFAELVRLTGPAAEGMTVSVAGLPNGQLPVAGKAFVAAFGKAVGETPYVYSPFAAQAAEVLLNAIARSDGSRASVIAQLFKTRVSNGILGSFSIDANGDTTAGAVTIYRIVHGKPTVFRVITPPRGLLR